MKRTRSSGVSGSVAISLISQTTNGNINFNTPVTSTITGSTLIGLSFSGTSGQVITAEAAGLSGSFTLYVLNPDGSQVGFAGGASTVAATLIGKTLSTTGTYQIVVVPNTGVSGSVAISLVSQTTNTTINFSTPATNTINVSSLIGLSRL